MVAITVAGVNRCELHDPDVQPEYSQIIQHILSRVIVSRHVKDKPSYEIGELHDEPHEIQCLDENT